MTTSFSLTAQLLLNLFDSTESPPSLVVSRTITDVRFSVHQNMMLVVPMLLFGPIEVAPLVFTTH